MYFGSDSVLRLKEVDILANERYKSDETSVLLYSCQYN